MSLFKVGTLMSFICIVLPGISYGWDGYDYDSGTYVEIEKGNLVRPGSEIEIYDYGTGEYRNVEVQSIQGNGSGAEVEVHDYETGETRTLEMD